MKKAFAALPLSLFAVFSLASCGGNTNEGYSDTYENYLASVDKTALSRNMTMLEKETTKYYSECARIYYTFYQMDGELLDGSSIESYSGYIITEGMSYSYEGASMSSLTYTTETNISRESSAIVIHKNLLNLLSYDVISSSSFYKALTYVEDGTYTLGTYMDYEAGSITLKDGYISHLYLKDDESELDLTFSDYGTTVAKTIALPEE